MNNLKASSFIKDTIYYLTAFFPIAFCVAICLGFDLTIGILFSVIMILLSPEINDKKLMPVYLSFLILGCNTERAVGTALICSALLLISSAFYNKLKNFFVGPISSGIMLAGALTVTVLFTTDYFGIGATGNNVSEMVKSYISLGFHPNWRGVLYGTIVMVIAITFPRKFKKLTKVISASFIALVFTLVLNLLLNPSFMVSAINEISYNGVDYLKSYFSNRITLFDFKTVLSGIALFAVYFHSLIDNNASKKDFVVSALFNSITSGLIGVPLPYGINKNKQSYLPRIFSCVIIVAVIVLLRDVITRIPVHSCAVVVIVSAWHSVNWKEIKNSFNKLSSFICFVISLIVYILTDEVYGIIFVLLLFALYNCLFYKKRSLQ